MSNSIPILGAGGKFSRPVKAHKPRPVAGGCGECKFSVLQPDGKELNCYRHPPTATIQLVPAPPPHVGMQSMVFCSCPVVLAQSWCGEFEPDAS